MIALKNKPKKNLGPKPYWESLISSMTDALILVDPDATLRSVNKAALDLLGYQAEELIGRPVKKIILKEDVSILNKHLQGVVVAGEAFNMGLTFLTKQRKSIPANFSGSAVRHDGQIIGIVGVARDMREIRAIISELEVKKEEFEERSKYLVRMQKAMLHMMGDLDIAKNDMEKANRELRKLDQLKSDFVSTVSHELRSPLTVTREAISQVLDRVCGSTSKKQKQFLAMSIEGIDRLSRLIDNLLDISKIEAHKIILKRELIDIVLLVREVSTSFAYAFRSKGLEVNHIFSKDKIELYVDKDRMIQIFVNLLSNALKFTPAGSIDISIMDKETVVECAVADTGIGISDEDLPRIFSKFEQFSRELDSAEKGSGLGLAISKGGIELHRGKIWAESKLGQGTKISFSLPKYSSREVFKEYVTNGVAQAIREGASLSIIVFEAISSDIFQEKLGQDKIVSILGSLGQLIRTDLKRKADMSIEDNRAIFVVLPDTDKRGARFTADRLKSSCDDYLFKEGLAKEIEVDFRVASFPEDTSTEEELFTEVAFPEDREARLKG